MPRGKTSAKKDASKTAPAAYPGAPKSKIMQDACVTIGNNIREERKSRKFTMEELVGIVSISESYLGLLERGKRTPSLECLFEFCNTFGLTPNDLLLPREKSAKKVTVSDTTVKASSENYNAALSLLRSFGDTELEYLVTVMVALSKMKKGKKSVKLS